MLISRSCSWCDHMVPSTARSCPACGHESGPRMSCRCPRCNRTSRRVATGTDTPVALADVIARAISVIRSQPSATDHLTDLSPYPNWRIAMTAANDNTNANSPDTAPAAREAKRTPVSAELSALIRALDEALFTTFGFDQCYVLMARDGIIAASSSVHGHMSPIVAPASQEGGN